jgi:hypothetical protein
VAYGFTRLRSAVVLFGLAPGIAALGWTHTDSQTPPQSDADVAEVRVLMTRVGPPSDRALKEFKKAGMENVRPHTLTNSERTQVETVLLSLPSLTRHVLEKKLHNLAFVDGIPGEGTGLTSPAAAMGNFDITLRASILNESLSHFLTTKERRVFTADESGMTVQVKGTGADAATYVLLHESTHVIDNSCKITSEPHNHFVSGIWASRNTMVPKLASSAAANTYFHGGHPIGLRNAAMVYDSLTQTPFVSLYATVSAQEDFAELVAWREMMTQHNGNLVIEIDNAAGKLVERFEPLTFPEVKARFANVDELLRSQPKCSL